MIRCNGLAVAGLVVSLSLLSPAQIKVPGIGGDKNKKEQERKDKEQARDEKNTRRYDKLKRFSTDKYATDPDFRDRVDDAYEDLMREHSQRAYERNINRKSFIRVVHEDSWRVHEGLYDNLLVQDHVNRIGQRVVPKDSDRAFAFRIIPDPTPLAETLATGTVYVSTGLISMLDTEAQLAYVLAHEMAHVQLDHWKERVMMEEGQDAYAEAQQKKTARWTMLGALGGAAIGGAAGQSASWAATGAMMGASAGLVAGLIANRPLIVDWDRAQEDAADEMAFRATLGSSYDVREIPKLYIAMARLTNRDRRVGLGFIGDRRRVEQRREKAANLIENAYKADIETQLKNGFRTSSAEHVNLMAELKRDNGIMAYYHDMFDLARNNLQDAIAIRDNDPAAHYFYGKTMKLIGRTDEELRAARDSFAKATLADTHKQNYGAHLHLALMMAREKGFDRQRVASEIDTYVNTYAERMAFLGVMGVFPPNLDSVFEYMQMYGNPGWEPRTPDLKALERYRALASFAEKQSEISRVGVPVSNPASVIDAPGNNTAERAREPGPKVAPTVKKAAGVAPVKK